MNESRLDILKERLQLYITAEKQILDGAQSYNIGSRSITRANLSEVRQMIENLEKEISYEESKLKGKGRRKAIGVIPRDL